MTWLKNAWNWLTGWRTVALNVLAGLPLAVAVLGCLSAGMGAAELDRAQIIRRAHVWTPMEIEQVDLRRGLQGPGAFAPADRVTCDFLNKELEGNSPKFACRIAPDDEVKVKQEIWEELHKDYLKALEEREREEAENIAAGKPPTKVSEIDISVSDFCIYYSSAEAEEGEERSCP